MNEQDFNFLASYEHVWEQFKKDSTMKGLSNPSDLARMNQICIRHRIEPANLGCGNCIPNMFRRIMTLYDKVKAEKAAQEIAKMEEPKAEPIKIKIESKKRKNK